MPRESYKKEEIAMSLVEFQREEEAAILTFNRPEKLNALCSPMLEEFRNRLMDCLHDDSIRAIIITGKGRGFVAGADIEEYSNQGSEQFNQYQRNSRELFTFLHTYPKPIIAAVNGYALGGGFEIVLACDIIIASEQARFGLPETTLGLVPGGGGIQKLRRITGRHLASDILFSARRLHAEEALHLGLASHVVPGEELLPAALKKAKDIAKSGPLAIQELKRLLHEGSEAGFETALSIEQEVLFRLFHSADGQEGIQAFVEKRKPHFKGK
jgi:enoyl-CoA hydratase